MTLSFKVDLTNKGWPAFWESGGMEDDEGYSQIVASKYGEPLKPRYINRKSKEKNRDIAEFALKKGHYLIIADIAVDEVNYEVYQVTFLERENSMVEVRNVTRNIQENEPMIQAAIKRAQNVNSDKIYYANF